MEWELAVAETGNRHWYELLPRFRRKAAQISLGGGT